MTHSDQTPPDKSPQFHIIPQHPQHPSNLPKQYENWDDDNSRQQVRIPCELDGTVVDVWEGVFYRY